MFLPPPARSQYSILVWLERGQGEVRGACDGPTLGLGGMYPPNCPTWTPLPQPTLPDSPALGQKPPHIPPSLAAPPPPGGLLPTVSWGGSWHPEPRGPPPRSIWVAKWWCSCNSMSSCVLGCMLACCFVLSCFEARVGLCLQHVFCVTCLVVTRAGPNTATPCFCIFAH